MDFDLDDEQQDLRDLAARILADRSTLERLRACDASEEWIDRETWAELARANLLGTAIPEDHGGLGYGFLELCLLLTEVGRHVTPVPVLPVLVSFALPVAEFGTAAQQAVLAKVADGTTIATAALAEPLGAPDAPATTATPEGAGWRLDGVKTGVAAAHVAAVVLVPATLAGGGIGLFLVPTDATGTTARRQRTTGQEPHTELTLEGVQVDGAALLGGDPARGREILEWTLARTTVAHCALAAGLADRAVRLTAEYSAERTQFGRAIGSFQAVGQRLADAYIDAMAIELTMLQAASHLAEGRAVPDEVATAKFWAAEAGSRVGHAALHVHGGVSIDLDFPIHRYFLWLKQLEHALGGASAQLARLGAHLADEPA